MNASFLKLAALPDELASRISSGRLGWGRPLALLVSRTLLFAAFQALIALAYAALGYPSAWDASTAWWLAAGVLTNLTCIGLLIWAFRAEGGSFRAILRFDRAHFRQDWPVVLGFLVVAGPVGFLPNILIANALFGSFQIPTDMMFRPLPMWAAASTLVLFPLTIAFSELPLYYGYVMPRLEALSGSRWLAVALPVFFLSFQHCALPLIWDARFILYRFSMFLLFALVLALLLRWRPRLLPYMMVIHGLIDFATAWMVFSASL